MSCRYCGTPLPPGALFCGECGRAVESEPVVERAPAVREPVPACPQCGEPVDGNDVFCGECGFVLGSSRDTAAMPASARAAAADVRPARPTPDPFPWGRDPRSDVDLEETRIVPAGAAGERFVLQFSTGESVTVTGTGLVGRNPVAQPGEYVDQLVPVVDAGKSVSKTHLEFGQEGGRFWVSDRFSTNGSIVRQPDVDPKRCEPGRRYFVARGTRVDIGEQFFVVS